MKVVVLITGQLRDYKVNCLNHMKQLIEPNNADVFVYACTKNTIHSCGKSLDQKYYLTNEYAEEEIKSSVSEIYGENLKAVVVDTNEKLPEDNFGTLGYFRTRMQNQIDNIGKGYEMAKEYSKENGFEYDVVVRCRPDNSMFPKRINLKALKYKNGVIYSTKFTPSGHRDLCFFAISSPHVFEKYCSFKYLEGEDPNRVDSDFVCTEHMWEEFLKEVGVNTIYIPDVCRPFTGFDKTKPVADFPHRVEDAKLIDHLGNFVDQKI
tara:strand:+ start:1387 stop:2178 length:792 start_codon:yes stop_codon:yes gene_type:complete